MNENLDLTVSWMGTGLSASSAVVASKIADGINVVLQYAAILVPIVAGVITIVYTIYKWAKRAMADNKISQEEVDELMSIIGEGAQKLEDAVPAKEEAPHD